MPAREVAATWAVEASQGLDTAWVRLGEDRLAASGRAVGLDPEPYWVSYELDTGPGWVTRRLAVELRTATTTRAIDLRRDDEGGWRLDGEPLVGLDGALDCDLGRCPLTNTMPVLRHGLDRRPGRHEFTMAWVSVPDLRVHRSEQVYAFAGRAGGQARVDYEGRHRGYAGQLRFGPDGLVELYPGLGRRIA